MLNITWSYKETVGGVGLGILSPTFPPNSDGACLMINYVGINFQSENIYTPIIAKIFLNEKGQIVNVGEISEFEGLLNINNIASIDLIDSLFDDISFNYS